VAAVVEITSGTVNILLKLTNKNNTEFGTTIARYLFWLELLSLSGELTVTIHNGLKKSAREVLEHEDELLIEAKKTGVKKADDILDEIRAIADEKVRSLNIGDDRGETIDAPLIAKIAAKVRNAVKLENFDIHIIDRDNAVYSGFFKKWQQAPDV
jgi:hypothetical protein